MLLNKLIHTEKLFLIAGPCVIENEQITFEIAEKIKSITEKLEIPFIFKASYKKQNRTKADAFTGPGIAKGLQILEDVKTKLNIPLTTDVHSASDVEKLNGSIDMIQIPAFLCRQTDIIIAAAKTNKFINVKKAPFLSGESCKFIIEKVADAGNKNIIVTERGNSFGYQDLIVDMRNIPIIKSLNVPAVLDVTHSNQRPNQVIGKSGGTPQFIENIACAGVAAGANGIFLETHPNPKKALSDGSNMLPLSKLEKLLKKLIDIKKIVT